MKINQAVVFSLVAIAASPAFAQGKGGGNAGGGNAGASGASNGGGFDRPSMSAPSASRPVTPDSTPNRHANDAATLPSEPAKDAGKGQQSASTAAQGLATSMHDINQTSFAQRSELHKSLDLRLESSRAALKKIQTEAKDLRADARTDFKAALADVKKRETELNDAVKASKKADEARWNSSRDTLARAFQNHEDAMARLEAIPRPPKP